MAMARFAFLIAALAVLFVGSVARAAAPATPNIVVVLCDDLGYGDVRCLNPEGKIATPHFDRLAREGVSFTDAHSGSSVCTPTRYGLITGRYAWRTRLQSSVLGGLSPRLIEPGRETLASLLRSRGYTTACVGKWHLGMNWRLLPGREVAELGIESREQVQSVDYSAAIADGPTAVGFDRYFGISASLDMVPFCFIENDRVTALPTEDRDYPLFLGRATGMTRKGPAAPGFAVEDVLPELTRAAVSFIERSAAGARAGKPFFLYLPLTSPHTPVAPTTEWRGRSPLGHYGDFVMQTDDALGRVVAALEREGIRRDTLIILTSDNGCSPQADFPQLIREGHNPSGVFRGNKADIFDGGHRVPFIASWPAGARQGATSDRLVCLTDIFATCAEIVAADPVDTAGEDSFSFLSALTGSADPAAEIRTSIVHHSINGSFAIRDDRWKLAFCPDSGGWSDPRPGSAPAEGLPPVQLYDMRNDPAERTNLEAAHPEIVGRLTALMEALVERGRSTAGATQRNAVMVDFRRPAAPPPKPADSRTKVRPMATANPS